MNIRIYFLIITAVAVFSASCFASGDDGLNTQINFASYINRNRGQSNEENADNTGNQITKLTLQNKKILLDFRENSYKSPIISKSETETVLKYLFGNTRDESLAITSRISGSFTKRGAQETLYYVGGCEEEGDFKSTVNCGHVSWWNAGWIAIYNGTTPVAKIEVALGYEIAKVTDVNSDGVNEFFSKGGFSSLGETEAYGLFGQISGNKYKEIASFVGYKSTCESPVTKSPYSKIAVISYIPTKNGRMPAFTEEFFQSNCKDSHWRRISRKEFEKV